VHTYLHTSTYTYIHIHTHSFGVTFYSWSVARSWDTLCTLTYIHLHTHTHSQLRRDILFLERRKVMGYSFFVGVHKADSDNNGAKEPESGPSIFAGNVGATADFTNNGDLVGMLQRREQELKIMLHSPEEREGDSISR
jgi:hypothetical protein